MASARLRFTGDLNKCRSSELIANEVYGKEIGTEDFYKDWNPEHPKYTGSIKTLSATPFKACRRLSVTASGNHAHATPRACNSHILR